MGTPERDQFLWDIFVTAIEGGITYWARIDKYHHSHGGSIIDTPDLEGFSARIFDTESEKYHDIHRATIKRGLKRFHAKGNPLVNATMLGEILSADTLDGTGEILDASAADCIVQAGLFGEVIYG